jgi:hypothetical protein
MRTRPLRGHRHHALDQPRSVGGRIEYHHVAAPRMRAGPDLLEREGDAQTVGALVDDDVVAGVERVLHRAARHEVVVGERRARRQQAEHGEGEGQVLADFLHHLGSPSGSS